MILIVLALATVPPPDLTDPNDRAVAEWASCAVTRLENATAQSRRHDSGLVDDAMRDCRPAEEALRAYLVGQSNADEAERAISEIRARIRTSLIRNLRGLRR